MLEILGWDATLGLIMNEAAQQTVSPSGNGLGSASPNGAAMAWTASFSAPGLGSSEERQPSTARARAVSSRSGAGLGAAMSPPGSWAGLVPLGLPRSPNWHQAAGYMLRQTILDSSSGC